MTTADAWSLFVMLIARTGSIPRKQSFEMEGDDGNQRQQQRQQEVFMARGLLFPLLGAEWAGKFRRSLRAGSD